MSQATSPEGIAPDAQPLGQSAPLDAVAAQQPAGNGVEAAAAPANQAAPTEASSDDADLNADPGAAAETDNGGSETGQLEADEGQTVLVDETFVPADAPASAADIQAEPDAQAEKDGPEAASADGSRPPRPTAVVRYGAMRSIGEFRHNSETPIPRGVKVVIRSERGVELGEVVVPICAECDRLHLTSDQLKQFIRDNGPDYPFRRDGRVLRLANPQDVIDYRHLEQSAREAAAYCRQIIRDLSLDMRLVAVEHLLGGESLVFYFAAEHRVDFREMVRMLACQYRTRIEMRQVGARDEARLVADYERCGQQCCCQRFLKDLRPVSMRMAKTQKATLDPSKISGRCGRLMCCLRYEDATYEQLRKKLPRKNTWVRTADGVVGRVLDAQIITQLVKIQLADFTFQAVANEDIVERDLEAPPTSDAPALQPTRRPDRPILRKRERLGAAAEAQAESRREQAMGDFTEDLAAVGAGADDDATDDAADLDGADLREAAALDEADQTRQPVGAAAPGGNQPAQAGAGAGKKRRRRRRRKGPHVQAAQAAGAPQAVNNTRGRGDQSDDSHGREREDGDAGGEGDAPAKSTAGSAGQAGQAGAGASRQGGDRKSRRQRRRRRGHKGQGNQNRPTRTPPPA
jgi:cell fate regulator YaaT (PSP1 superfamily)